MAENHIPKIIGKRNKEIFFYSAYDFTKTNTLIYPVMAGKTNKDPDYVVKRTLTDPYYEYLYVLEYVISGTGHIEYGGRKYTVKEGDFYILNRCTAPYYYSDKNDPIEKIWINICGRFMNSLMYAFSISEPVFILHMDAREYISKIHAELENYDIKQPRKNLENIMHIMLNLFQCIETHRKIIDKQNKVVTIESIVEYIAQNITAETLTIKTVATNFYVSERTLHRMFSKRFGISPIQYISKKKMEYAQYLLVTTDSTIEKIASDLNFSSSQHFRTVYKDHFGSSPQTWRKNYMKTIKNSALNNPPKK